MAGERDGFLADAFHQAAVTGNDICLVIDEPIAEAGVEMTLGNGEAHGVGDALPQGAGGCLDARGVAVFGMAGGLGAHLAELLEILDAHVLVSQEIEQRIDQARTVPGRQDETVAVGPVRVGGIEFHELREQHGRDIRHAHRHAGMAGVRLLNRVHGQETDGVGHGAGLFGGVGGHELGLPSRR